MMILNKLTEPFAISLVGKFNFCRPNMDHIRDFFHSLKLSGSFSVGLIDAHHILIKLKSIWIIQRFLHGDLTCA